MRPRVYLLMQAALLVVLASSLYFGLSGLIEQVSAATQPKADAANETYRRAVDLLTVHGRRHNAGLASLDWASLLHEHGRADEAEPILRRAYDLGVDAELATRKN